jgi:hypothetical protein
VLLVLLLLQKGAQFFSEQPGHTSCPLNEIK